MKNSLLSLPPHHTVPLLRPQTENDFSIVQDYDHNLTVFCVNLRRASYQKSTGFKELISKVINSGVKRIIIDLTKQKFIDSAFMGAMVFAFKSLKSREGELKLVYSQEINSSTFFLTGMDKVIMTYPDLASAVSSFS